jgi:hypothetical protein
MFKIKCSIMISLFFYLTSASAAGVTVKVEKVGCHTNNNVCFVYVDKPITSTCPSSGSLRWDISKEPSGKAILSILLTAQSTGKSVDFWVSGCFSNYPTFSFATIKKS